MTKILDTHFHLDFLSEYAQCKFIAQVKADDNFDFVGQSVLPSEYSKNHLKFSDSHYALGFHPWWIKSDEQAQKELVIFEELALDAMSIGEVGLDFSPKILAVAVEELQRKVFEKIVTVMETRLKQREDDLWVSIHAVRSTEAIINYLQPLMQKYSQFKPIIHWFSGNGEELVKWKKLGGYFSINPQMLKSKKGRAYVKQIPQAQLLLETDLPLNQEATLTFEEWKTILVDLQLTISKLKEAPLGD